MIERIQSPSIGGSIAVLRRTESQESDNGKYVGATDADPHKKRGGQHYPPPKKQSEKHQDPQSDELTALSGQERIPHLDITA
jgi:hypothetical protein